MAGFRLGLAVLGLVMAGVVGGLAYQYMYMGPGPHGASEAVGSPSAGNATSGGGAGGPAVPAASAGGHRGPRGVGGSGGNTSTGCVSVAGVAPGELINWLFENHDVFEYRLWEYPENRTLVWVITAPDRESLEKLVAHIEQMRCIVERGGTPRPSDPLFAVDARVTREYVETRVEWLNETAVRIVKTAENECAYRVIELHAEVVKGFFETGRLEAARAHEVPEDVLELCKPYLESVGVESSG